MTDESSSSNPLGIPADPERSAHRHTPAGDQAAEEMLRGFVIEACRTAADLNCEDVLLYDVRALTDVTDYIIIASGTSDRQMRSVGDDISGLARDIDLQRYGRERDDATTWLVIDFVDVVVHLFEPVTRAHYDLEMLWGDAEKVDWRR